MNRFIVLALLSGLLSTAAARQEPVPVSLVQLIATPERFSGKVVSVTGYLVMEERSLLYVHRDDAENLLPNAVPVVRSAEMIRHKEQLNHMYVVIVGVFREIPGDEGRALRVIEDVKACTVWSDPARPRQQEVPGKSRQR